MVGTGKGAENGILFKSGQAIETLQGVNTIVFDKTGTITEGKPQVTDIHLLSTKNREQVLQLAKEVVSNFPSILWLKPFYKVCSDRKD